MNMKSLYKTYGLFLSILAASLTSGNCGTMGTMTHSTEAAVRYERAKIVQEYEANRSKANPLGKKEGVGKVHESTAHDATMKH